MLRTLIERASRNVVIPRHLPDEFGGQKFYVSPDAALGYLRWDLRNTVGCLLKVVRAWVAPDDVVWDIGASMGVFGLAAASRAGAGGSVLAMEPDPFSASLILRSSRELTRSHAEFEVLCAAAAREVSLAGFAISQRGRSTSHLAAAFGSTQTGGLRQKTSVVTVSLDWLLEHRRSPNVVKIDVEGADLEVISGADRLLGSVRPLVLLDVHADADELTESLLSHRYVLYDQERPASRLQKVVSATLAIPEEREGELGRRVGL